MNTAIVVITIGDACTKMWNNIFAPSVLCYSERHGYEVIQVAKAIDDQSHKPPQWQKLLIPTLPEVRGFDRIVYLDTDVLCNPDAPSVAEAVPDGKVGAVTWRGSYFNDPIEYDFFRQSWRQNEVETIRKASIGSFSDLAVFGGYLPIEDWLNSGVLVYQPTDEIVRLFRDIYENETHSETSAAEQAALTDYLCRRRTDLLHPIDRRFNRIWYMIRERHYPFLRQLHDDSFVISKCVEATLMDSYFLHFAADGKRREACAFMRHQHLLENPIECPAE